VDTFDNGALDPTRFGSSRIAAAGRAGGAGGRGVPAAGFAAALVLFGVAAGFAAAAEGAFASSRVFWLMSAPFSASRAARVLRRTGGLGRVVAVDDFGRTRSPTP
jgi:hypothetical protein